MKRKTKQDWLREGLKVLTRFGEPGLNIDTLTQRLGVTKGSFYHHFKSRNRYVAELLAYWEDRTTQEVIRFATEGTFEEKYQRLKDRTFHLPNQDLEVAIRGWAWHDPVVRQHLERVDARRMAYLEALFRSIMKDGDRARTLAHVHYLLFVGATQVLPAIKGADIDRLLEATVKLLDTATGSGDEKDPQKWAADRGGALPLAKTLPTQGLGGEVTRADN